MAPILKGAPRTEGEAIYSSADDNPVKEARLKIFSLSLRNRRSDGFRQFVFIVLLISWLASTGLSQNPTVEVYAGGGALPLIGAPALPQKIDGPFDIAPDGTGGFYVMSYRQSRIYRVASDGTLHHVAGAGVQGFSGDGGPAIQATFNFPTDIDADDDGNLYVADRGNYRVRKIGRDGLISTVAGVGTIGFSGDGGPAIMAQTNAEAIAVDGAGNLYIADSSRIRKVGSDGIIRTVAGNGTVIGDGGPAIAARVTLANGAIDVDRAGNIYLTDFRRIRKISTAGVITTIAGTGVDGFTGDNGPATSARIGFVRGLAADDAGNVYISEATHNRVRAISARGIITTIAGTGTEGSLGDAGPAQSASLFPPGDVATDRLGNIFIADGDSTNFLGNSRIPFYAPGSSVRRIAPDGIISTVLGDSSISENGQAAARIGLHPADAAADTSGNIYIADTGNHRVLKVTPDGLAHMVGGTGRSGFSGDSGPATAAELWSPTGVAVDPAGNIYIADSGNRRVRKVDTKGVISTFAGSGVAGSGGDGAPAIYAQLGEVLCGIAVDSSTSVYIAECETSSRVRRITPDGIINTVAGTGKFGFSGDGGPAVAAQLGLGFDYFNNLCNSSASVLAVDSSDTLYIADILNSRVRKVDNNGLITTVAESYTESCGNQGAMYSVAVDGRGTLYFADNSNRISRITPDGLVGVVAGSGDFGLAADGVAALQAPFQLPYDITFDRAGNLLVVDNSHRLLRVNNARIAGYIDGFVQRGSSPYLYGWACLTSHSDSIAVHVYAGGSAWTGGTLILGATANLASEPAVASACESNGSRYRFEIPIPAAVQQQYEGQAVYVHGISPFPEIPNLAIGASGIFAIPNLTKP